MRANSYWERRAWAVERQAERAAAAVTRDVGKACLKATRELSDAAARIRKRYMTLFGLSEEAAEAALREPCGRAEYEELLRMIAGMPKGAARRALEARASSGAYSYRMTRAEALRAEIEAQTATVTQVTERALQERMTDAVRDGFRRTVFDAQKASGLSFSFHDIQRRAIAEVVAKPWSGKHFSQRLWGEGGDMSKFTAVLNEEITAALLSGKGSRAISEGIAARMQAKLSDAARLARTELHYAQNMGAMRGLREAGFKQFRFLATLDGKTSKICQRMDGRVCDVKDAKPGVNMPPMHPNCRSTMVAVMDEVWEEGATRRAVDPETGEVRKVPAGMTYKQWEAWREDGMRVSAEKWVEEADIRFEPTSGQPPIPGNYRASLEAMFNSGTPLGRQVYDKYVPHGGAVADSAYRGTPYCDSVRNSIYMNFSADATNPRGVGTIWFHEHGHFIDYAAGHPSANRLLRDALIDDYQTYISAFRGRKGCSLSEAQKEIGLELSLTDGKNAISDLFGGISQGKCTGRYGHRPSYWSNPRALTEEAFAHMIVAEFDAQKRAYMAQYFPTAFSMFETILGGIK